ncbi:MAG: DNA cytosine methyltransferase [Proteobacteria bacterium]|nr:DNA cytosine methyltransferase [Pseudomonadota bacterium]
MKLLAYYNEIDTFCCDWLSNLMDVGVITPGYIDNRSIEDVTPDDVSGYTRVGFFAGIGVWDYALRLAGWPEDRPVWHGSCPCQPFSSAGKGKGFKDERHLWPEFYRLISQCRPPVCFGEQVASKDGLAWVELVQANMESSDYAFGAVDTCSASFGAPHIRQRLYWVGADTLGNSSGKGLEGRGGFIKKSVPQRRERTDGYNPTTSSTCGLADSESAGSSHGRTGTVFPVVGFNGGKTCRLANTKSTRWGILNAENLWATDAQVDTFTNASDSPSDEQQRFASEHPGPTNGHWRDADWLLCRDGRWRPVESSTAQMADGLADRLGYSRIGDRWSLNPLKEKAENRVGRLRCYGNAINAEQAKAFIEAFMEVN